MHAYDMTWALSAQNERGAERERERERERAYSHLCVFTYPARFISSYVCRMQCSRAIVRNAVRRANEGRMEHTKLYLGTNGERERNYG